MRWIFAPHRNERGASAILVASSLVLMMGIAAMAVDFGAGANDRRQNQTATDTGAIAGALSMFQPNDLVNQVLARTRNNLRAQFSDADWRLAWRGCTDPGRPVDFRPVAEPTTWPDGTAGSGTLDCISRNSHFLRVTVPTQIYDTAFGGVIGLPELSTRATTVVTILPDRGTGLLPFAVRGNVPAGEICLDSGTGSSQPPCDGSEAGSFGNIAPPIFGNPFIPTAQRCSNQTSSNNNVAVSIAMGIDHLIWKYTAAEWASSGWSRTANTSNNDIRANADTRRDECIEVPGGTTAQARDGDPINTVWVDTGNSTKTDVTNGLVSTIIFPDGQGARLWRTVPGAPTDTVNSASESWILDDTPLWFFLLSESDQNANGTGVPACYPAAIAGATDQHLAMITCLEEYQAAVADAGQSPGVIFNDDIAIYPRFGQAPQLWHESLGSGQSLRPVEQFRTVYINRILFKGQGSTLIPWYPNGNGSDTICQLHNSACNPLTIDQVTALLIPEDAISQVVKDTYPGGDPDNIQPSIYE